MQAYGSPVPGVQSNPINPVAVIEAPCFSLPLKLPWILIIFAA